MREGMRGFVGPLVVAAVLAIAAAFALRPCAPARAEGTSQQRRLQTQPQTQPKAQRPTRSRPQPIAERVVIVVLGGVGWDDLDLPQAAGVRRVFESGWVANMSCPTKGPCTIERALLTLSAAAAADAGPAAGAAYGADEEVEQGTASEAYVRRTARLPSGAQVVHLGVHELVEMNASGPSPVRPGLLGESVVSLGRQTAVLGNSDLTGRTVPEHPRRQAVLLAMDETGRVRWGDVGVETLVPDAEAAYGLRTNVALLLNRYRRLPDRVGLVVIDMGDTSRASRHESASAPAARRFTKGRALARASELLERLVELAGEEAAILVVSPAHDVSGASPQELTPMVMLLPGARPGLATSLTTRRPGLVSGIDLVRTVRWILSGEDSLKSDLGGRPIARAGGPSTPVLADLARRSVRSTTINEVRPALSWVWLVAQLIGIIAGAVLVRAKATDENASRLTEALLLWLVAFPLAGVLVGWLPDSLIGRGAVIILVVSGAAALAAALTLAPIGASRRLGAVVGALAAVILCDQAIGSFSETRLAADTVFGYSLLSGGRYYGIGNEAWSLLFAAVAVGVGLFLDADRTPWPQRRWLVAATFALVALFVGLPFLGANVGGFISCAVGFAVIWLGLDGKRLSWRWVLGVSGAVLAALVALTLIDLASSGERATHLGTVVRQVGMSGLDTAIVIAKRKLQLNLSIFQRMPVTLLVLPLLALAAIERRRPSGALAVFLVDRPRLSTALTGVLVASVVGLATNDTGVTVPALMAGIAVPAVLMLMLAAKRWRSEALAL